MDGTHAHGDETTLTPAEYEAVRAAVADGARDWADGEPPTLNALLRQWRAVVEEVEEGYSWCAPELSNDIWCRSALARVWTLLPPRVREIRRPELSGLDDRFRAATIPWPGRDDESGRWWTWRVPRILEAEYDDRCEGGWPLGWDMMPFPKPDSVTVVV
ncbi:hypothetical protein ABZ208_23890 [Streptomyces sp. NPDC006208]|uniref:hypothetical protein n=1 Tax=Streptomyces sp. NPDC006208 TaxID=3156734 RepID=UPI0033A13524